MPPTFTHPYVSRRYSLIIGIEVDSFRDTNFQLQVPVHVSYDRRQGNASSICEDVRVPLDAHMVDEDVLLESCSPPPYMAWYYPCIFGCVWE